MSRVLNLLLTHQSPEAIGRMRAWWERTGCAEDEVLIAFNGTEEQFARIAHRQKILVRDPRLETRRHHQERQSYTRVLEAAVRWLAGRDFSHVHFAEYDQVPLVPDLAARQLARLEREQADVLGFQLVRVDGTNHPHYLYHAGLPGFCQHWEALSVRAEKRVVLSMFGSGSFWTREALEAVAAQEEPFPIYLELYLPTLAHHLGYRVRGWDEQEPFALNLGDLSGEMEQARADGAWTLHPVKSLWG